MATRQKKKNKHAKVPAQSAARKKSRRATSGAKKKTVKRKSAAKRKVGARVAASPSSVSLAKLAGEKSAGVVLEFTKDENSPEDVRVTLQNPEKRVLRAGERSGSSDPRQPGTVQALVQVKVPASAGGGRTARIKVTNVTASPIVVSVPPGSAGRDVTVTLTVVGKQT